MSNYVQFYIECLISEYCSSSDPLTTIVRQLEHSPYLMTSMAHYTDSQHISLTVLADVPPAQGSPETYTAHLLLSHGCVSEVTSSRV